MNATVLIVEDEADIMLTIRLTLQAEGYHVIGVTTGEAALEIFADSPPDVTVLDVALPGIDGLEVVRRLRKDAVHSDARIIITSAHASGHVRLLTKALGCEYLTKPFSTRELAATVAAVLARRDDDAKAAPAAGV
jgi:two-component system, OmpR family, response regulator BaeR